MSRPVGIIDTMQRCDCHARQQWPCGCGHQHTVMTVRHDVWHYAGGHWRAECLLDRLAVDVAAVLPAAEARAAGDGTVNTSDEVPLYLVRFGVDGRRAEVRELDESELVGTSSRDADDIDWDDEDR